MPGRRTAGHTAAVPPVIRVLNPADLDAAWTALETAFGASPHPADRDAEMAVVDPARFYAAYDDDWPVATAGSFDVIMTVPGAALPVAGVTWVGVLPTYRRQGLLGQLMARQLQDLHAAGTAVAALWASEGAIYQRYGYGPAAWTLSLTVPRGAPFRDPVGPGGLQQVEPSAAALRAAYDEVAGRTVGWLRRDDAWWGQRLHDPEHRRAGGGPLQCVTTDGGYALYSTEPRRDTGVPAGTVRVRELVAATAPAGARLWRHLLDLDLMRELTCWGVATDDPLLQLLAEPRRARPLLCDNLWVRLVELGAALSGRRYAADVDVVLDVDDAHCPWNTGRWHLVGDRAGATCGRTDAAADLVVSPADLGAAYLGGTTLHSRAVRELTPGALGPVSTAFGPLGGAPYCPQVF